MATTPTNPHVDGAMANQAAKSDDTTADQSDSRLLALPRELRDMIYEDAFRDCNIELDKETHRHQLGCSPPASKSTQKQSACIIAM
jgi:hypothetical protein